MCYNNSILYFCAITTLVLSPLILEGQTALYFCALCRSSLTMRCISTAEITNSSHLDFL